MDKKYLIIDGTSGGKLICREANGDHELRAYFGLFRKEAFDKIDNFIASSQVGDSLNIEGYFTIVRYSGNYELFLARGW